MASDASVTHIGRSTTLRGELSGDGDVLIDGSLEGSVQLTGARITVGPDAKVRALLSAQDIIVHGRVEGELRATGRVELRASAVVFGDIFATRLSVEDDATVRGHVDSTQPVEKDSDSAGAGAQAWHSTTLASIPSGSVVVGAPGVSPAPAPDESGRADEASETQQVRDAGPKSS